ncbi:flagellar hook-basal body complex protein [Legionella rowbothamii]|uniref:flagellar hook-basal body complex protein n=1 Tax=Legionella rowbothamii TaxID=96229 RepID=UPI001055E86E|nr:flagellar hook-basal body complex protein [Legionella rowbothamii]
MNLKSILIAGLLLGTPQLYAGNFYNISNVPLNICALEQTGNPLDLALRNEGYLVVSQGKKDSELLFTRYGAMGLDPNGYIRTYNGEYLLAINKKSDPKHLSKLKVSTKNLPPKATSQVFMSINLPADAHEGSGYHSSSIIYDSISGKHTLEMNFTNIGPNTWSAQVIVDDIKLNKGTLVFKGNTGKLTKQEGLAHILWPADYGLNEMGIDLSGSTQFVSPFSIQTISSNGYPLGLLANVSVSLDGGILLLYNNGVTKELENHIAVAKFTNPSYLESVTEHLYRVTAKSGPPRLHWTNSQYAILSGYLEAEPCLAK